MTSGIVNGTLFSVHVKDSTFKMIGFSTSCSISITQETRPTTTAATGIWNTKTSGYKDWEVSCDSLVAMSGTNEVWHEIYERYLDDSYSGYKPVFEIQFKTTGTGTSGDKYFKGSALITSFSLEAPMEESATFSVSFSGNGPLELLTAP